MKNYYVYILTNKTNKVMYIGVTNDLSRRIFEHKQKIISGFTKQYNINRLVYCESHESIVDAIKREKQLKGWIRKKKNALVETSNPEWKDLSLDCLF